jgi:hypothetical protein
MEKEPASAEAIARLADEDEDISSYFTNDGKMMPPLERGEAEPSHDASEDLRAPRQDGGTDSLL